MKDKLTLEKYLHLKIIKKHPDSTRYWIIRKISKEYIDLCADTSYTMFDYLLNNGLIEIRSNVSTLKKYSKLFITNKGDKVLMELELRIRHVLFG